MTGEDLFEIDVVEVLRRSQKAILIRAGNGREHWIPLSEIRDWGPNNSSVLITEAFAWRSKIAAHQGAEEPEPDTRIDEIEIAVGRGVIEVSDWESEFIESIITARGRMKPGTVWIPSAKQSAVIQRIYERIDSA